jgi:hypothetical protein
VNIGGPFVIPSSAGLRREEGGAFDVRARAISGWWCTGSGEKRVGLRAELVAGPNWCPAACFHIFFVLIPFLFLFFPIFLHIIYKNASNQFKPLS